MNPTAGYWYCIPFWPQRRKYIGILRSGSNAQDAEVSGSHGLWDPCVYVIFWALVMLAGWSKRDAGVCE